MWRGGDDRLSTASTGSEDPCRSPSKFPIVATSGCFAKGDFAWRALCVPDEACREASGAEALELSTSRVSRGVVLLERDAFGELHTVEVEADIALARCPRCGTRARVLPCDVLARKRYSLGVIAEEIATYTQWMSSLRSVAWGMLGERTPTHSTLHGWTEGLGAHVLGLPGGEAGGWPLSRFVAEAEARVAELGAVLEAPFWVDERRYRCEARRERLSAVARVIAVAKTVTGLPAPACLVGCRRLAVAWSSSCVLVFPSRFSCTAIEHSSGPDRRASRDCHRASRERCPTRTRSPPGASSRSRPF